MALTTSQKGAWSKLISDVQHDALLDACDGRCFICGEPPSSERALAIDHNHATGQIRGLLCSSCNRRLGGTDSASWLRRAALYLERSLQAFPDYCRGCEESGQQSRAKNYPVDTVKTNGRWTTFRYVCHRGHEWECSWTTVGAAQWYVPSPAWKPDEDA